MHMAGAEALVIAPYLCCTLLQVILSELCERITYRTAPDAEYEQFHSVLSILSYLLKVKLTLTL